jgi:hypothetical protein
MHSAKRASPLGSTSAPLPLSETLDVECNETMRAHPLPGVVVQPVRSGNMALLYFLHGPRPRPYSGRPRVPTK